MQADNMTSTIFVKILTRVSVDNFIQFFKELPDDQALHVFMDLLPIESFNQLFSRLNKWQILELRVRFNKLVLTDDKLCTEKQDGFDKIVKLMELEINA
jgi:hypothetical protein